MSNLPWVRVDSNIASHDKVLELLELRDGYRSMCVYVFALGWSGGSGTDGHVKPAALPMIHGRPADARNLVQVGLWDPDPDGHGWWIHNYAQRQEISEVTELRKATTKKASSKANCVRWHGPDCGCWKT